MTHLGFVEEDLSLGPGSVTLLPQPVVETVILLRKLWNLNVISGSFVGVYCVEYPRIQATLSGEKIERERVDSLV